MRANTHVTLVVDNTAPQTQRSKCATSPQPFLTDQHPIYGGKAEIVRTQQSGGYWHFRMWISEERKYVRKTLKTTHLDTAVERAENEFFAIKANVNAGRRIFSPTVQQAEDEYLAHRWNVDVKRGSITEGRWATIKSHLNHFVAYCGIVGREAQSSVTRLNDLESKSLQGYQQYRQQKGAKDVTIKNEQSTINALCKWAFEEGLHNIPHYIFPSISRRGVDADSLRRSTYSDDEYGRITRLLIERIRAFLGTAGIMIGGVSAGIISLLIFGSESLIGLFIDVERDSETLALALEFVAYIWPVFIFAGFTMLISGYLTAVHLPFQSALVASCRSLIMPAGFLILFYMMLSDYRFVAAISAAEAISFVIEVTLFIYHTPTNIIRGQG